MCLILFIFLKKDFIYLREREREHERRGGAGGEGEAGGLLSREPDRGLDPGPRQHELSRRQTLNRLGHPGTPTCVILKFEQLRSNDLEETGEILCHVLFSPVQPKQ